MTKTIYGRLYGKTIELDEDLGVPDGQQVEVEIRFVAAAKPTPKPRRLGTLRASVTYMAADFDAPLDEFEEYMP